MLKFLLISIMVLVTFGCGGDPSISVLPNEEIQTQTGKEFDAKMDILWVIDNSGSMNDFQQAVQDNLADFMEDFVTKGIDFQIAVTVTDAWQDLDMTDYNDLKLNALTPRSRFIADNTGGRVLKSEEDDNVVLLQKFEEMIDNVTTTGAGDERIFQSMQAARMNQDNVNDGFFREDAHLAVIMVSDEEDNSWASTSRIYSGPGCPHNSDGAMFRHNNSNLSLAGFRDPLCTPNLESVSYYQDFLENNSSEIYGVAVHNMAIVSGDSSCRTSDATYQRYYGVRTSDLATRTNGTISSLCGNFSESLSNIAKKIIERSTIFPLEEDPANPEDMYVGVRNPGETEFTQISYNNTNGFLYDSNAVAIVFYGDAIPLRNAELKIVYDRNSL